MPFYPSNSGRRPFPSGRFGPPNGIRRQPRSFFTTQNQQAPTSRLQGLQTVMGHVGKVTTGIGMLRQMGGLLKFF